MTAIDFTTLPAITRAGVAWSFFWRGVAITIASSLTGALLGATLGFLLGITGAGKSAIPLVGGTLGLLCGLAFFYFYVHWLLTRRLGRFRLTLVPAEQD